MFVTAQGTVAAAQVERSAGFDFDLAAIGRAKQLEFAPAQLNGSSVPAWILLPLETTAAPEECPSMAVPVSAGMATFADSELLARPELGTLYRFVAMDNVALDITIYPRGEWPPPSAQVHDFIAALDSARDRGDFSAVEVEKQGDVRVKVRSGRPRHDMAIDGHAVRATLTTRTGQKRTTYYAVFLEGEKYVKFRATYDADRRSQGTVDEFIQQVLSARASTPSHCPR